MMRPLGWIPFLMLLVTAAMGAAACATARSGAGPPPPAVQQSALSVIYGRMLQAISRPGEVYHPTVTTVIFQEPFTVTTVSELWIDPASQRARVFVRTAFGDFGEKASTWIIDGDRWYETQEDGTVRKREAVRCRDSDSVLLSLLLGCRDFTESAITAPIDVETFEGTPVAALYTQGTIRRKAEDTVFIDTLYVHARTFLPIALERSGSLRPRATGPDDRRPGTAIGQITRYTQGFVPGDSLAPDFFDPAALGYVEPDPAAPVLQPSPDFTYYWLDRETQPAGLPPLALKGSFVAEAAARPLLRYRAVLKYRPGADEFGETLVELQEWRADEWDTLVASGADPAGALDCAMVTEVDLGGRGRAMIYAGRDPAGPNSGDCSQADDTFFAVAHAGSAVIRISAPGADPWNSEEGMRAALAALVPVDVATSE
ncbi:MAG TPA: hypothetical protein VJP07_10930 [Dehalococcoidia bacterium]|nr:hypothetical protein [Dehalococcoidia bacterium]